MSFPSLISGGPQVCSRSQTGKHRPLRVVLGVLWKGGVGNPDLKKLASVLTWGFGRTDPDSPLQLHWFP